MEQRRPNFPFRRKAGLAAIFAGIALLAGGPASTRSLPASQGEIERFCSNIVDAARERRYAIQAQELEGLQRELDERIALLEQKRTEYEEWLGRRNAFLEQAEAGLVQIYSRMRPDAAAGQLKELRADLAASILMKLDARQASVILNEMESKAAAALTTIMASAARPEDPT